MSTLSLDETVASWNLHKVRTAGNKTPLALYQLSREKAINQGYWTGDPGDDVDSVSDSNYGKDPNEGFAPADELANDPQATDYHDFESNADMEREAGIFVNDDEEIRVAKECLDGYDFHANDELWNRYILQRCSPSNSSDGVKYMIIISIQ